MTATALQPKPSATRSLALRGFEINPFRILRLSVRASTGAAAFQAESVLTLARLGLQPEEEDLLPWLPSAGPYELQQAAQLVEEPLSRLKEQLLWFDLERDPHAVLLREALRAPRSSTSAYLAREAELGEGAAPCDTGAVAHAIDLANLRLLLAAVRVSGGAAGAPAKPRPPAPGAWQTLHGVAVIPEAHRALTVSPEDASAGVEQPWGEALRRWVRILAHPWFRPYLDACLADLGDDFVSSDDAEAVEESIRGHLADLAAQEVRFLLLEGRFAVAAALVAETVASGLDARVLGPALRPLRHVFQAELSELEPLLEEQAEPGLDRYDAYLKRLAAIRQRWLQIDAPGLIGLRDFLDEAAEQVYLRLRGLDEPGTAMDALLARVEELASARSLRERVGAYRKELEAARTRLCHFCKNAPPDYDKSVVLHGRKETGREYGYNVTTVHFMVRYGIVPRCACCAKHHDFIQHVALAVCFCAAPGLILLFLWLVS